MEDIKKRLDYFDVFRSLGIMLMIMGHIGFGENFDYFIHAFHMPMFFFISGYFYKGQKYRIGEYIGKKAKSLLIPYLFFGIAHYIISLFLGEFTLKPLLHLFTTNTEGLPICGALWFLTALFFTEIIYYLLDNRGFLFLLPILVIIGHFSDTVFQYPLPWSLSPSFVGLGLYWFGKMTKKYENKIKKILNLSYWQILVIGIITVLLIFTNGYINMREGTYAFIPLFWINALLSIFIGISISKNICRIKKIRWFTFIGKNSIVYLCLNQIVIKVLVRIFDLFTLPKILSQIFIFVACMIVLYCLSLLFTRTKLAFFIGKIVK